MPKTKQLENKISKKLERLSKLLDKIDEVRIIDSDDPETWDSDALYNLVENLKEALQILEDQEDPKAKNSLGEPLILAVGLLSLMDEYHSEEENSEDI